jgi:hypothetical protein
MIFGGYPARPSRRREKLIRREVFNANIAKPSYLKWLEVLITFDREDRPDHVPHPRSYLLVVALLFKSQRVHKVLMDGGSGINVLYAPTLDDMGIPRPALRPSTVPFHRVVPGMEALPIGQIDLSFTFGDVRNLRMETLTFEVVEFSGTCHAILGRPAYAKFMVVPNYTYPKLKIPGPKGIITVRLMYQRAYECNAECFQFAEASSPRGSTPSLDLRSRMSPSRPSERPTLSSPPRTSRMWSSLTTAVHSVLGRRSILNRKACSSTSSKRTSMCLHGNPPT